MFKDLMNQIDPSQKVMSVTLHDDNTDEDITFDKKPGGYLMSVNGRERLFLKEINGKLKPEQLAHNQLSRDEWDCYEKCMNSCGSTLACAAACGKQCGITKKAA